MDTYRSLTIRTTSRLTPAEKQELRNEPDSIDIPDVDEKDLTQRAGLAVTEARKAEMAAAQIATKHMLADEQGIQETARGQQPQSLGKILIAVVDDGAGDKKSSKPQAHGNNGKLNPSQIQASASMDNLEFEIETMPQKHDTHCKQGIKAQIEPITVTVRSQSAVLVPNKGSIIVSAPSAMGLRPSQPSRLLVEASQEEKITPFTLTALTAGSVVSSDASVPSTPSKLALPSVYRQNIPSETSRCSQRQLWEHHNLGSPALQAAGPPSSVAGLDLEHFRVVFQELAKRTERLEQLSDQIIEALTLYQPSPTLGSKTTRLTTAGTPLSPEEVQEQMKGKKKAIDLDEEQLWVAQSFADLVLDTWPKIYKTLPTPRTTKTTKVRVEMATKLKDSIVAFWSVQNMFQEMTQFVLDVYQDPIHFEQEGRTRILKSRHLNSLLMQEPLDSLAIQYLIQKHERQQDKLLMLSEPLQNIWLGVLMLLDDSSQNQSSKINRHLGISSIQLHTFASSSSSYYLEQGFKDMNKQNNSQPSAL
ncbi:hypothetical protein BX616_008682 [Lobosporangium transversale]|nr:hypothetical protein BX616_008682 [Lobosporangium transversale]